MTPRVNIATILCQALDNAELPWAITHGAEGFPERVGRDFDILLPESFHRQAVTLVKEVAARHGWSFCLIPLKWAGAPVFLWKLDGETLYSFEMHFINHIDWGGCMLADGKSCKYPPVRVNGLPIATWPSFAKRVLTQILAGCWNRIDERPDDFVITPDEMPHLSGPLTRLFGHKAGNRLLELIRLRDLATIRRLALAYRVRLVIRALVPGTGIRMSSSWICGKIARTFGIASARPPFLIIAHAPKSDIDAKALLDAVISHLGFAKTWTLPQSRSSSLIARLWERWSIHLHRSLFRLVAFPIKATENIPEQIDQRIGRKACGSGIFIADLQSNLALHHASSSKPCHDFIQITLQSPTPSSIAHAYLQLLSAELGSNQASPNRPTTPTVSSYS